MGSEFNACLQGYDESTIVARCTPSGPGAIAMIRISGSNACTIAAKISRTASGVSLEKSPSHSIVYGSVCTPSGVVLDRVLFLVMRAPRTFTGEDVVEICCHNNQFVVEAVIDAALQAGARLATPGEFSKRAVINGKLSLLDAEAINELAQASTVQARNQALAQLDGSLTRCIEDIEQLLFKALAYCESSFEFLDEEITFNDIILSSILQAHDQLRLLTTRSLEQKAMREGVRVAFLGSVNAGKSSLFNALLRQKRAIVTALPGTTRDTLEASLYTKDCQITLVDTAGLRQTDDVIEQEGIERSYQEALKADLICLLFDSSRPLTEQELSVYKKLLSEYAAKIIMVQTKSDSFDSALTFPDEFLSFPSFFAVSLTDQHALERLENQIISRAQELCQAQTAGFLLNKRQALLLQQTERALNELFPLCVNPYPYELISVHLKDALALLTELSGKSISEKGMDAVFHEFCVGK